MEVNVAVGSIPECLASAEDLSFREQLLVQISKALKSYLEDRPRMSIAALSMRSSVSETTLRRIRDKDFKRLPNPETVLNLLSTIYGSKNVREIADHFSGAIKEFLFQNFPQITEIECEYSVKLNQELQDDNKYLVYKLCSNKCGVTLARIQRLLGAMGVVCLEDLLEKGFVEKREGRYFSNTKNFTLDPEQFASKFQLLANFIKVNSSIPPNQLLRPLHVNYSSSVTAMTYKKIVKLQKKNLKKVRELLMEDSGSGDIPLFFLLAVDSLDTFEPNEDFSNLENEEGFK